MVIDFTASFSGLRFLDHKLESYFARPKVEGKIDDYLVPPSGSDWLRKFGTCPRVLRSKRFLHWSRGTFLPRTDQLLLTLRRRFTPPVSGFCGVAQPQQPAPTSLRQDNVEANTRPGINLTVPQRNNPPAHSVPLEVRTESLRADGHT